MDEPHGVRKKNKYTAQIYVLLYGAWDAEMVLLRQTRTYDWIVPYLVSMVHVAVPYYCSAVYCCCQLFFSHALQLKFEFCHFFFTKNNESMQVVPQGFPKHKGAHCDLICKQNFERTLATASYPGRATQSTIQFCCLSRQASPTGVEYGETRPEWYITDTDPTTR